MIQDQSYWSDYIPKQKHHIILCIGREILLINLLLNFIVRVSKREKGEREEQKFSVPKQNVSEVSWHNTVMKFHMHGASMTSCPVRMYNMPNLYCLG